MTEKTGYKDENTELRSRAEAQLCRNAVASELPLAEHDLQRLLHELQVQQVELEMQNEELHKARDEVEKSVDALRLINEELEIRVAEKTEELTATLEELQRSEKRFRSVVEGQTDVISRFQADGKFIFVNDVYCRLFGKSKEELLDHTWHPVVFSADVPIIEEKLGTMSVSNPVVVIENRVYSGTGKVLWMQFVNSGFFDKDGRLVEIQSVGRDITERKQIEDELRSYARRLIVMEEALRKQIATELHDEIGRDLTVLGMNLMFVRDNIPDGTPQNLCSRVDDS